MASTMEATVVPTSKSCKECGAHKPIEEFPKNPGMRDGHINTCKVCNSAYLRGYYKKRRANDEEALRESYRAMYRKRKAISRAIVMEAKDVPCIDCGRRYPSYVLDLHHRDGTTKVKSVSQMMQRSVATIEAEIAKCDVLCANCHRVRHHAARHGDTAPLPSKNP